MKRGRPSMREEVRQQILSVLAGYQYPATINTIKERLEHRRGHPCGWDTVQKYLQELTAEHLVLRQSLPTERGHKPLVVYMGRAAPIDRQRQFLGTFFTNEKEVV